MTKEEVLQQCKVIGTVVKLPDVQLERKLYLEVEKSIELIGGKWKGGKVSGFVFPNDPNELLAQISNGEKRNLKKEFQFFSTPELLANKLVSLAELNENDRVLEPSAGQGAIIKSINKVFPKMIVECFELMPINQTFLHKIDTAIFIGENFLEAKDDLIGFDKIIANPPFNKNQDIDHILKMFERLKPGGRLVSVSSKHWQISGNKKESNFKQWLIDNSAEIHEIENGKFKDSGTMISCLIIVLIKKPNPAALS